MTLTPEQLDPRLRQPKMIRVGVFPHKLYKNDVPRTFNAYTVWYNPSWKGCCEHTVEAVNGTEAKKLAIQEHKERCLRLLNN
jgi:hypothetical protein